MKQVLIIAFIFASLQSKAQDIKKWSLDDLKSAISNANGPTIFNFWATFCKPCIAEIPHFQQLAEKYKQQGVQLYLISVDEKSAYPSKIESFVQKRKWTAPVVYLNETNADLLCPAVDNGWSGAIPATLIINNKTGFRKFFEEEMSKESLENEILKMLRNR